MHGKTKTLIASLIAGLGSFILLFSAATWFSGDQYSVSELIDGIASGKIRSGHPVKVQGIVKKLGENGSFTLADEKNRNETISVRYTKVLPAFCREEGKVIIEGKLDENATAITASKIMARCPSRYEGREGE